MSKYYECHVTLEGPPAEIRPHVEALNWKFSAIDGDPVLGSGLKCYATKHYNQRMPMDEVVQLLLSTAASLEQAGCKVTRRKVELVLYDDRSSKVRCTGSCAECKQDPITEEDIQLLRDVAFCLPDTYPLDALADKLEALRK